MSPIPKTRLVVSPYLPIFYHAIGERVVADSRIVEISAQVVPKEVLKSEKILSRKFQDPSSALLCYSCHGIQR